MRDERRGFVLDRSLLGHGCCGGRGLVPLDRLRLAYHCASEHLVHTRDRNNLESALDAIRDFNKIFGVLFGYEHCLDAPTQGREQLLLETGDRPHAAAQRNLAGHGNVAAHGNTGHYETIAVAMATPAEGPSFGVAPSGTCTWMSRMSNKGG